MVSGSVIGGLVSRAAFLMSSNTAFRDAAEYQANTIDGIKALQNWYNRGTGLWDTTGWWNSANCLTTLADFSVLRPDVASTLGLQEVIQNTYEQAQKTTIQATKVISKTGLTISTYTRIERRGLAARGFDNFVNDFYDDEGWWALALIRAHDLGVVGLGDQQYLAEAQGVFEDMHKGNSSCGGIFVSDPFGSSSLVPPPEWEHFPGGTVRSS